MNDQQQKKVLILCTGNSCRSQMAEALINYRLSDTWQAWSAGTEPAGYVHPSAITALEELGIPHPGRSKRIADLPRQDYDLVITVCDDAADNCPSWLGAGRRVHLGFPDPNLVEGSQEQRLKAFRSVRDQIADKILSFLENHSGKNG